MDSHELNHLLIPGELADPKIRKGLRGHDRARESAFYEKAMSCDLPQAKETAAAPPPVRASAPTATKSKMPVPTPTVRTASSRQGYTQTYLARQKQNAAELAKLHAESVALEKKQAEHKREQDMRTLARSLSDQLTYWKGDHAQSSHDQQTIEGNINALQSQLDGIDQKYRAA